MNIFFGGGEGLPHLTVKNNDNFTNPKSFYVGHFVGVRFASSCRGKSLIRFSTAMDNKQGEIQGGLWLHLLLFKALKSSTVASTPKLGYYELHGDWWA